MYEMKWESLQIFFVDGEEKQFFVVVRGTHMHTGGKIVRGIKQDHSQRKVSKIWNKMQ